MKNGKDKSSELQEEHTSSEDEVTDDGKPGKDENAAGFLNAPEEDEDADPVGGGHD